MQARCIHCGQVHAVEENAFGNEEKIEVPCPACGQKFAVINPGLATIRAGTTAKKVPTITSEVSVDGRLLRLPKDEEISLRVLEGNEKGTIYPVLQPRITIGRTNADVNVEDRLASRLHCAIEITEDAVVLRDLDSTNGTFMGGQPVRTAKLSNGSAFRVGGHTFQLVIVPKGP